MVSVIAMKL